MYELVTVPKNDALIFRLALRGEHDHPIGEVDHSFLYVLSKFHDMWYVNL